MAEKTSSLNQKMMQNHHDYFVRKFRNGELLEEDQPNYKLAMQREKKGLVKPLPEKDSGEKKA